MTIFLFENISIIQVMRTLLDHGSKTSAKDTDERTPLHIAAQ